MLEAWTRGEGSRKQQARKVCWLKSQCLASSASRPALLVMMVIGHLIVGKPISAASVRIGDD